MNIKQREADLDGTPRDAIQGRGFDKDALAFQLKDALAPPMPPGNPLFRRCSKSRALARILSRNQAHRLWAKVSVGTLLTNQIT